MEGGENVERNGDGGATKPQNKEGAADDEEGIYLPQTKDKSNERNKNPKPTLEEKSKDESVKLEEIRECNLATSVTKSERDGENDLKEMTEYNPTENLTSSLNESKSKEVVSIDTKTTGDIKDGVEREKDNLQKLSSQDLVSQSGNAQMKISQHEKDTVPALETIKNKEESNIQVQNSYELNKSNEAASNIKLINLEETTNEETLPNKLQQSEGSELKPNKQEDVSKQEGKINANVGELNVEEAATSTNYKQMKYADAKSTENKNTLESDKNCSMPVNEGLSEAMDLSDKIHKTDPVISISQAELPPGKSKGKKDIIKTTLERKHEIPSTSRETMKPLSHKTDTAGKTMTKSFLKIDIDNKPTKSKSMELNKADKDPNEKKMKQKQTLGSNNRIKSPGRKDTLENSKQKSASTGTLSRSLESKQKQSESQPATSQEKSVKSKDVHTTKDGISRSPAKTQAIKNQSEKVISKGAQSSNENITEKPVHTVIQGIVSKPAKCDEKVQRSTAEARKNQERMNKVTAEITATTEAAIKEQFKQLESKLPQESPVQSKPSSPKQITKSPVRKQAQQRQQKPTQQKLQDQKQLLPSQRHPSPQKQKPARSPTRKQQEQKQFQQKQQPVKQQQKQFQKELSQPKQQTPQNQTTNLSKQEKQEIEIKQTLQEQQEIPQQEHQQVGKQEQPLSQQKTKQQINKVQQQVLIPKQKPQVKQIKQQDEPERQQQKQEMMQEQAFAYLKESKDQEQKEQCEKPIIQQDKETIEQHNLKQKQREQEEAMAKQLEDQEQEKQQQKEDQPVQTEQKEQTKQQLQQQSEDGDEEGGVCGMQGKSCPIYFGVKSYLHHFYDSTPIKGSPLYEEYIEEDDFEYAVDPIKNRGCRRCCRGFWFRAGLWGGINLILVGVITLLVGYLTPQREMVVGHHNNLEILDRSAIAFNRRLELCRLAGLAVFCCGGLVLLLTLLLSSFFHVGSHNNNNTQCCGDNTYYGYVSTSLVEPFIAAPNQTVPISTGIKIPITEQIKSVQPTLWPDIATVKDGTLVPHLP